MFFCLQMISFDPLQKIDKKENRFQNSEIREIGAATIFLKGALALKVARYFSLVKST